jgi:nucleotide-binding universal stress UspA family protein
MYEKILVPLDGSKLAECALPYAEALAQGCHTGEVILVSVTERVKGFRVLEGSAEPIQTPSRGWFERMPEGDRLIAEPAGKLEKQAQKYLDRIAKQMKAKGINASTEVLLWSPAEAIVGFAEEAGCDLIVMSSHGRSGPSRWAYGSVAEKVFRATCVPVLMVRAPGCAPGV